MGARVVGLQRPGTREEEGARGAEGVVAGEKGEAREAKDAAVFWGQKDGGSFAGCRGVVG